jgi:hypothetical protein
MCWRQGTPHYMHCIQEMNVVIKMLWVKDNFSNKIEKKIVCCLFYFNLKIVRFFCRTLYVCGCYCSMTVRSSLHCCWTICMNI